MNKSLKIIFIIILILLVLTLGIIFIRKNNSDVYDKNNNQTNTSEELENQTDLNFEVENQKNLTDITKKHVEFDPEKVMPKKENVKYEEITSDKDDAGLKFEVKDGKVYLTTDINNNLYNLYFSDIAKNKIENKEIEGFTKKVQEVYLAYMGNGDVQPLILFLIEDGTVEYLDSKDMLKNENYKSSGKLGDLSNIVKFVDIEIKDIDKQGNEMSGARGVVAVNEDGVSYNIADIYENL